MIDVRLRTRCGWLIASCWAIMPPIDMPTTCADSSASASSSPAVPSAMSIRVYGTALFLPRSKPMMSGVPASTR